MVTDKTLWTAIRSLAAGEPILDENLSVTFLKIRASGDLSGTLPVVTGVVTPVVPIWNGSDWSTSAPTGNAAALARWIMTGPAPAEPLRPDQIDESCAAAYELIEANGWEGAIEIVDECSQRDALLRLGVLGRFGVYWNGRKLCFVTEWEKPVARQIFAGRNVQGYRYQRSFPKPVHALIVEFKNADEDSEPDETIVYNDGYSKAGGIVDGIETQPAEIFETLRLETIVPIDRAYRDGRAYLAKRKLQVEFHEWTAGADSIATTFGDRVLCRHPSTLYGLVDCRVDFRRWAGGLVSGVRLDAPVTMEAGKNYGIDIRRADFVIRGVPVVNVPGTSRNLVFATPQAENAAPEKGDLIVFGEIGIITEDLEIADIQRAGDMQAKITAIRYIGPEIMAAETGPIPPLNTTIIPRQAAPQPRFTSSFVRDSAVHATFEIDPKAGDLVESFVARYRRTAGDGEEANPWLPLPGLSATSREVVTPPIPLAAVPDDDEPEGEELEYQVDLECRSILRDGSRSLPGYLLAVTVREGIPAPINFVASGLKRTAPDGSSHPAIAIVADAVTTGDVQDLEVEIRPFSGGDWKAATGSPFSARNPSGDVTGVLAGQQYALRARWRTATNWTSAWTDPAQVTTVPADSLVSAGVTQIGGLTPDELIEQLTNVVNEGMALGDRIRELAEAALEYGVGLWQEKEFRDESDVKYGRYFRLLGAETENQDAWVLEESTVLLDDGQSLATYRTGVGVRFDDNEAAIVSESVTRATADSAMASNIFSLQVQASGFVGSITTLQSVTSGLGALWSVALNVNGHVSGIYQYNNGLTSSFIVSATQIGFSNGSSTLFPLAIIGGKVIATNFQADDIVANSITTAKLVIGGVTTDRLALGAVTNGNAAEGGAAAIYPGNTNVLVSVGITTAGGKVQGTFSAYLNPISAAGSIGGQQTWVNYSIYRNGTFLTERRGGVAFDYQGAVLMGGGLGAFGFTDNSAPSGFNVYYGYGEATTDCPIAALFDTTSIQVFEAKR
jgi:hypothetical protein